MGITFGCLHSLQRESQRQPFKGVCLTLGKQDLLFNYKQFSSIAPPHEQYESVPELKDSNWNDKACFEMLGFDKVVSMDISDYEGADILFDLNKPAPPPECLNAFDCIYDGGTLEHVFHVPNALNNIALMLKVNGRIIHHLPVNDWVDHGFYMLQPTLLYDFYEANGFSIRCFEVLKDVTDKKPTIKDYKPLGYSLQRRLKLRALDIWHFKYSHSMLFCVAEKQNEYKDMKIPTQSIFVKQSWVN